MVSLIKYFAFLLTRLLRGATELDDAGGVSQLFLLTRLLRGATQFFHCQPGLYAFLLTRLLRGATWFGLNLEKRR